MSEIDKCPDAFFDQNGLLVCMRNLEAPGDCTPGARPYPEEEGR